MSECSELMLRGTVGGRADLIRSSRPLPAGTTPLVMGGIRTILETLARLQGLGAPVAG